MNFLIGSWSEKALQTKSKLVDFVTSHRDIQFQDGALSPLHKEDHNRYWEYATALGHTQPAGKLVLDAGGANSILTWYLGSVGTQVVSIDNEQTQVNKGVENNKHFGLNNVLNLAVSVIGMGFKNSFDYVYCINVIEHVMEHARRDFIQGTQTYWSRRLGDGSWVQDYKPSIIEVETERMFMKNLARALKPGGVLVMSYEYKDFGQRYKCQSRCAYLRNSDDVQKRIIDASGLKVCGELDFTEDMSEGPRVSSTGIIFLQKENEEFVIRRRS